ncbi:MAG: rubrerythrin family protein [Bacteroidales bacterium]|nr:rubrerythrin family protein [Bacteroidales bacterium]
MESKSIKGTRTEQNLLKAFAGESQAKNRYTYFAKIARKEGYEQIASFFEETALQEEQHAKVFFKFLEGGMVEITASYPAGILSTTPENLLAAAEGENEEWAILYPDFAEVAKEEGFPKIATKFRMIAQVEAHHEKRYRKLLENIKNEEVFKKEQPTQWMCRKCGFIYEGTKALQNCPACDHPQSYFEMLNENY